MAQIAHKFVASQCRLGVIESCTGGGLGAVLTSLPGASQFFEGGIIAYSNTLKSRAVYVRESTLQADGAVSENCVKEMANGGLVALNVDCCLAITGIAGPDGGSAEKPVGTVWLSMAVRHLSIEAWQYCFAGDRQAIQEQAVDEALRLLSAVSLKRGT
jgi:nicotinamide-nucleotide amidase